jgi:hypothetical protein
MFNLNQNTSKAAISVTKVAVRMFMGCPKDSNHGTSNFKSVDSPIIPRKLSRASKETLANCSDFQINQNKKYIFFLCLPKNLKISRWLLIN